MTDWVDIANSAVAPKAPVTSELMNALRDNTITTMWEDVSVIYDFAVDGAVNSVTTPLLEDGWDYGLVFSDLSISSLDEVLLELQQSSDDSYKSLNSYRSDGTVFAGLLGLNLTNKADGDIYVPNTRLERSANSFVVAKTLGGLKNYAPSGGFSNDLGEGASAAGGSAISFSSKSACSLAFLSCFSVNSN